MESFNQRFFGLYWSSSLTKKTPRPVAMMGAIVQNKSIRPRKRFRRSVPADRLTPRMAPVNALERDNGTLASSPPANTSNVARSIEKTCAEVSVGRSFSRNWKSFGPSIESPRRYPAVAIRMPVLLLTIPLPIIVPEQAERLFPPTTMPRNPARTSEAALKRSVIFLLGTQGLHDSDNKVVGILAEVQNIIRFNGRLDIVVERGKVQLLPRPVNLVQHTVLHIVALFLQTLYFTG